MNIPQTLDLILHNTLKTFHRYHAAEFTAGLTMQIMMDSLKATHLQDKLQRRNLKQHEEDTQVHMQPL